jgi:glycosyltransferase involved in cell wall biosynthesis
LGLVAHARVVEEMAKAEVFLLLSKSDDERLPNVVKEGMASGCVCITTPTRGIEELVEHEVTGFVVPMSDPTSVAAIVDRVFAQRVDVSAMTERARDHIARDFDLGKTAPRYLALWGSALQSRKGSPSTRGAVASEPRRAVGPSSG